MIIRRFNPSAETFEPLRPAESERLNTRASADRLKQAGFKHNMKFLEPSARPRARRSGPPSINDIYSGYKSSPSAELSSGNGNTVSWINGQWTVPMIRMPLWFDHLTSLYPGNVSAAILAQDDALNHGFACSTWIGIFDNVGSGGLVQAGVDSYLPDYVHNAVNDSSSVTTGDGVVAVFYPFFEWTSGAGSLGNAYTFLTAANVIMPGDTIQVLIQILQAEAPELSWGALATKPIAAPALPPQAAVFYFGNVTQNWYTAFVVTSGDLQATPLNRERVGYWVAEQSQHSPGYPSWTDTSRGGSEGSFPGIVQPIARHATFCFTNAACGAWTGKDEAQPLAGPLPPLSDSSFVVSYPGDGTTPVAPQIISDYGWNYIYMPLPSSTEPHASALPLPPLGPANQPGLPNPGTAVSAGQLIAKGVIMCKYVYPLG